MFSCFQTLSSSFSFTTLGADLPLLQDLVFWVQCLISCFLELSNHPITCNCVHFGHIRTSKSLKHKLGTLFILSISHLSHTFCSDIGKKCSNKNFSRIPNYFLIYNWKLHKPFYKMIKDISQQFSVSTKNFKEKKNQIDP